MKVFNLLVVLLLGHSDLCCRRLSILGFRRYPGQSIHAVGVLHHHSFDDTLVPTW